MFTPSDTHIKTITRCFINKFQKFFLYENLEELITEEERGTGNPIQYKDTYTDFRYIHHFDDHITTNYAEYERVCSYMLSRIQRLYTILSSSKKVLFLSDSGLKKHRKNIPYKDLFIFHKTCTKLFPNTEIHIHFTQIEENKENPQSIEVVELSPYIQVYYTSQQYYCIQSYTDKEYSLNTHVMYNNLTMSNYGYELAELVR